MNKTSNEKAWEMAYEDSIIVMNTWKMIGRNKWSEGFNEGMSRAIDILKHYKPMPKSAKRRKK